ncbi:Rz1-like lysis system protein LysC [Achromobacter mucicolens]|nr:Rz1-like lysis system protein LysC [Achromobacter mucicolens]MDH1522127.1 Rz1-like lysis system protein LysC [Achromobacter mucicolens]
MKIRKFVAGLILCCLILLQGCASAPPSPGPRLTLNTCAPVTPCSLPAAAPRTAGDLNLQIDRVEAAWAICAAKVDSIIKCQSEADNAQGD